MLRFIGFGLMNLGEESGTGRISGAFGRASEVGSKMASNAGGAKTTGEVAAASASGEKVEKGGVR